MTLEDRIVAVLEAIGLDMKAVQALAGSRHLLVRLAAGGAARVHLIIPSGLPIGLRSGAVVRVPVTLAGGVQVGLAAGGHVQIYVGV